MGRLDQTGWTGLSKINRIRPRWLAKQGLFHPIQLSPCGSVLLSSCEILSLFFMR